MMVTIGFIGLSIRSWREGHGGISRNPTGVSNKGREPYFGQ
jgi:hypothetical protein